MKLFQMTFLGGGGTLCFCDFKMEYLFPNGHEHSRLKCNKMVIEENTCLIHAKQQVMHQIDSPKLLRIPKEKKMLLKQEKHVDT